MKINNSVISIFLVLFAIISFFLGFSLNEISMGAGWFNGDFKYVKKSITLFSQNSIIDSVKLFSETSNRPPLIYILHKIFNPFFTDEFSTLSEFLSAEFADNAAYRAVGPDTPCPAYTAFNAGYFFYF